MRYRITQHCKERYIERVLNNEKCDNVFKEILDDLIKGRNITSKISVDTPRFILYIKEHYKASINFIEHRDIIYILTKIKGTEDSYSVLTCYKNDGFLEQFKNTALTNDEIHHKLKMLKQGK